MNYRSIIFIFILSSLFSLIKIQAQETETKAYLKGLVKVANEELGTMKIQMDGETFPIYNMDDERVRGMEMMEALMSGDHVPEFYMDDNKEIKAAVLRKSTDEEKKMIKEMSSRQMVKSDLVGQEAKGFTTKNLKGDAVDLEAYKGKVVVLNFWFVECKPCVMEMPELNAIVEHYKDDEVVFIGFAINKKSQIESFLKKNAFHYQIIPESTEIIQNYGVTSFPTHIIIGKDSKIAFSTSGLGPNTISDIENTIEALIK